MIMLLIGPGPFSNCADFSIRCAMVASATASGSPPTMDICIAPGMTALEAITRSGRTTEHGDLEGGQRSLGGDVIGRPGAGAAITPIRGLQPESEPTAGGSSSCLQYFDLSAIDDEDDCTAALKLALVRDASSTASPSAITMPLPLPKDSESVGPSRNAQPASEWPQPAAATSAAVQPQASGGGSACGAGSGGSGCIAVERFSEEQIVLLGKAILMATVAPSASTGAMPSDSASDPPKIFFGQVSSSCFCLQFDIANLADL